MLLFRLLSIVGLVLITVLSLVPGDLQVRTPLPKTVEHFGAYLGVALVLAIGRPSIRYAVAVALVLTGFAGIMEFLQELVPGRDAGYRDFFGSALGAGAGAVLAHAINRNGMTKRLVRLLPAKWARKGAAGNP